MRDRASVNNVAIQTLNIAYPCILDVGCFSHTLDHVGEKICTNILAEFVKGWVGLFHKVQRQNWLGEKLQVCQSLLIQALDGGRNGR